MTKLAGKLLERGEKEDENWINYEIEDLKIAIRFKFKKKNLITNLVSIVWKKLEFSLYGFKS